MHKRVPLVMILISQSPANESAKRTASDEPDDADKRAKARRRAFSCISCQRLKCRCDYDFSLKSCRRCHALRIDCSRKDATPPPQDDPQAAPRLAALEEKLLQHDKTLAEISKLLKSVVPQISESGAKDGASPLGTVRAGRGSLSQKSPHLIPEDDTSSEAADQAVTSAPIMVLREIGCHFPAPLKRSRRPVGVKLISDGLLDVQTTRELINLFLSSNYNSMMVPEVLNLDWCDEYRQELPFLHSVCCLHAIVNRRDIFQSLIHRNVFERIRAVLGTILLDSPSALDDIQGVLMMTDSFRSGAGDGKEYIDSWMLTGYCAKQAMLSIDFNQTVSNTRQGQSSSMDVRSIRLWSMICLHHLHWAATTGRPSTITDSYLNHCQILLNFYEASVQDGVLLAEVSLYSALLKVLGQNPQLNGDGDCDEFATWKHEWRHLFALPAASMLQLGYASACLILIVRALEEQGEPLGPAAFLSRQSASGDSHAHSQKPSTEETETGIKPMLRKSAAKNSQALLQIFLGMSEALRDSISSNRCLCLTYSALILAHYDESQSKLSDKQNLKLIIRLHEWFNSNPGKSALAKYTKLSRQIIMSRLNKVVARHPGRIPNQPHNSVSRQTSLNSGSNNFSTVRDNSQIHLNTPLASVSVGVSSHPTDFLSELMSTTPDQPFPEQFGSVGLTEMLPNINMEDFFTGGYMGLQQY